MIFVSHDFRDRDDFANVIEALGAAGIAHFDPNQSLPGASLRDKLREAIDQCVGCIFIATRHSIQSSWCQAELGAFWGTGKRVCTLVADKGLADDDLPPQLRGDLWTGRLAMIVAAAREMEETAPAADTAAGQTIGALQVPAFVALLKGEMARLLPNPRDPLDQIRRLFSDRSTEPEAEEKTQAQLIDTLGALIGMDASMLDAVVRAHWPWHGDVEAMHGRWIVHSLDNESGPGREIYTGGCLLLTARDGRIASAGAADWIGGFFDRPDISRFKAFVGGVELGRIDSVF